MAADLHLPHQLPTAFKTLTAQCHCKSVHFTVTVPTEALPLPVHLCHCSICRYTHGTFCSFHAPLPLGIEPSFVAPSSIEASLTKYIHSPLAASERFFCSTCGCHIGDRDLKPDAQSGHREWRVASSVFTATDEATFQIRSHVFTTPALEPNLATWLPSIAGRKLRVWNPAPDDPNFPLAADDPAPVPDHDDPDNNLLAQCHCAGVKFAIPRPSAEEAADPFLARFLRPSRPVHHHSRSEGGDNSSGDGKDTITHRDLKRVACLCLCADCRLVSGAHAVPWTFVPLRVITPAIPPGLEGSGSTLRAYRSSEHVRRAFCRVCGATVLYVHDGEERAPDEGRRVVDVAVGVLRGGGAWGEGLVVEGGLAWRTGRVGGRGSGRGFDEAFADAVGEGLGRWGEERFGGRVEFNIPQDL